MVALATIGGGFLRSPLASFLLAAAEVEQKVPALQRMEPGRRAQVLAAVTGLLILAGALMLLAWMGARATRRYMNRAPMLFEKPPTETPIREKDWADKPLSSPFEEEEDEEEDEEDGEEGGA
jgi:hydroxymethylglutaryl-CoA reductase